MKKILASITMIVFLSSTAMACENIRDRCPDCNGNGPYKKGTPQRPPSKSKVSKNNTHNQKPTERRPRSG